MQAEVKDGLALIKKAVDPMQRSARLEALKEVRDEVDSMIAEAREAVEAKAKAGAASSRKTRRKL